MRRLLRTVDTEKRKTCGNTQVFVVKYDSFFGKFNKKLTIPDRLNGTERTDNQAVECYSIQFPIFTFLRTLLFYTMLPLQNPFYGGTPCLATPSTIRRGRKPGAERPFGCSRRLYFIHSVILSFVPLRTAGFLKQMALATNYTNGHEIKICDNWCN